MREFFLELYGNLPRQAPGDERITKKALSFLGFTKPEINVLDVGCGSGFQSIVCAEHFPNSKIQAVDLHEKMISELKENISKHNLQERIFPHKASMDNLSFAFDQFDLILSEGSIYNMGLHKGLEYLGKFLRKGGYFSFSELTWLKEERPESISKYWKKHYPEMGSIRGNLSIIESLNYKLVGLFVFPEYSWFNLYYTPLEEKINHLRKGLRPEGEDLKILEETEKEISMFKLYSNTYSYVYYILQKP
ncbi:MAG: class I SAM-dependent methyltransferase [Leptospiraceae bacterium]|nr:class I SAM-dependent methyltransferase [Leptospiraceae bacterium]MCP5512788.1 class I SAM-dependent methyltransferase [Leptospiraceae bacterium]